MQLEELGFLFKNDPTFDYIFNELPRSWFLKIAEFRKKRLESQPRLSDIM
jgi:hypothetical protein